jgi:hypothetical protein
MYRTVNRSFMHHVVNWLSAMFLVAALSLFATTVGSAAGSSGRTGKVAKHSTRHRVKHSAPAGVVFGGHARVGPCGRGLICSQANAVEWESA